MNELFLWILWGFLILFFLYVWWYYLKTKKRLSEAEKKHFWNILKNISLKNSYKEQILDYDTLYHKILLKLWYEGSFGEILKQEPRVIWDVQHVWNLHKLRNKLAHEFDILDEKTLENNARAFQKAIISLLKNIS